MNFAQVIKRDRERRKLTQVELADELGVSTRTLIYWENGQKLPTGCTVFRLPQKWQKVVRTETDV